MSYILDEIEPPSESNFRTKSFPKFEGEARPIIQSQQDLEYYKDLAKYQPKLSQADQHQQRRLDVASRILAGMYANPELMAERVTYKYPWPIVALDHADALIAAWERTGKK